MKMEFWVKRQEKKIPVVLGMMGVTFLVGCATPAPHPVISPPPAPSLSSGVDEVKHLPDVIPADGEDMVMALDQLDQDMTLSPEVRSEILSSLVAQPAPETSQDRLRRAQLLLLQHQAGTTQQAVILLQTLVGEEEKGDHAELLPLTHWLKQWADTQALLELQTDQLTRQSQELQGRADNLARQIQELRAIERNLSSRPGPDKAGTHP
ncbi:hypothetical protein FEMY_14820 [Ferrovum myxofaciens]|jgi:uncharacterized protein (DUF3084 family)|uniref:Uncharacterized protein n=2 Tax=root TaxID=1 RepID=A0A149VXM2_9PROT|nr:hypothetical protein [Ferrovum myxofaciens]KXW57983.1 hypothetical protein FEMY_14820 [Ferrovum myxofaciens]MBW8029329.1 hypothetical protein [Ferrovum sp.]NDU89571.1 hypothetical protein [Ferrovum sp.]